MVGDGMSRLFSIALAAGAFISLPALAAKVEVVQGTVSVNQGQGYKQVAAASDVSPGDQVMAAPGARGKIVYSDGCAVDVYPGAVLTVPGKCYQPMRAGLEPVAAPVAAPIPWLPIVGAAAVIGVGVCAVSECFDGDDPHHRPPKEKPRTKDGDDDDNHDHTTTINTAITTTIDDNQIILTSDEDGPPRTPWRPFCAGCRSFYMHLALYALAPSIVGAISVIVLSCDEDHGRWSFRAP